MSDNDSTMARELHAAFQQVAPDLGSSYIPWEDLPDLERRLAVRACWQATRRRDFLPAVLEEADLEQATKALARETVIRHMVAETGEPREIVAEMVDAHASMDQEAVLNLTEGEPTTLRDALERYVESVRQNGVPAGAEYDLEALLAYPYPEKVCDHGTPVVQETPSACEGAEPIRNYSDGCQSYGPYPKDGR